MAGGKSNEMERLLAPLALVSELLAGIEFVPFNTELTDSNVADEENEYSTSGRILFSLIVGLPSSELLATNSATKDIKV